MVNTEKYCIGWGKGEGKSQKEGQNKKGKVREEKTEKEALNKGERTERG